MDTTQKVTRDISDEEISASITAGNHLMTAVEVAELMRVLPATIRLRFKNGTMRAKKTGVMWYTTKEEIIRYIQHGPFKE
jgi:hypothetical protein